jgi:hypothetical protein
MHAEYKVNDLKVHDLIKVMSHNALNKKKHVYYIDIFPNT